MARSAIPKPRVGPLGFYCCGALLCLLFLATSLGLGWWLVAAVSQSRAYLQSGLALIVHPTDLGLLPGLVLSTFCVGLWGGQLLWLGPKSYSVKSPNAERLEHAMAYGMLGGLALTLAGLFAEPLLWHALAKSQGYRPCPPFTLPLMRLRREVLVKEQWLCTDPAIVAIVRAGNDEEAKAVARKLAQ